MEPLLYAFQTPRTIADTLDEYEQHLHEERDFSAGRVRATIRTLKRFLEPIEAPLVSLTPELARTLVQKEEERQEGFGDGRVLSNCLSLLRARRFFRWAARRGYVSRNPFETVTVTVPVEEPTDWLA
jgi:site-specific recombinase XerC